MDLQKSMIEGFTVFRLSGKIMGGPDATMLNDQLHTVLEQGERDIIVDLSQIELLNSSGLGILISALTTVSPFPALAFSLILLLAILYLPLSD